VKFSIAPSELPTKLIALAGETNTFRGYYVLEFKVAGIVQASYFFTFEVEFNASLTSTLNTNFVGLR
jgi:hypothetical protein